MSLSCPYPVCHSCFWNIVGHRRQVMGLVFFLLHHWADDNKEFRTSILRITTKKTKKRTDTRHNRKGEKMFETLVNSKLTTQLHATANSTKKIEAQNTLNPKWPKIHKNGHTQKFKWTHKSLSGKIANKMTCRDDPRINHHFFAFFAHNYFYWPASII